MSQSLNSEKPSEGLSEFFQYIWSDTQGWVYLPTLHRETNKWRKVFFKWPQGASQVNQHVIASSAKGEEVYYAPAMFKDIEGRPPPQPTKQYILGTHVLWSEFDGNAPEWTETASGVDPAPETGGTLEGAQAGVTGRHGPAPVPSLRVQSSNDGHEHVYWKLDNFCEDVKWFEDRNKSITYSYRSDTSGWDATQILRPPYTQNYKRNRPVTVVNKSDRVYPAELFEPLKPPPTIVSETVIGGDLPQVELVVAKYPWDDEHIRMFMDPQIEEGKRSSALMRLGYFCIEIGMSDTEAYTILHNADERWGKYKGRNDQKRRLIDIIDRARQKYPGAQSKNDTFAGLLSNTKVETGRQMYYGLQDFLNSDVEVEWVIEDLLEANGMGMVTSMPGVGKTQLSLDLGLHLALGKDFLKWRIPKAKKMMVLSLEMGHVGLKIFLSNMAKSLTEEELAVLQDMFIVVPMGEALALDTKPGEAFLETLIDEISPEGIIIDSMGKISFEDFNSKVARLLNNVLGRIRNRSNLFIWFIHHNRKATPDNKKPVHLSDVYGDQYLTADMSVALALWPVDGGDIEIHNTKNRYAEQKAPFIVKRSENLTFTLQEAEENAAVSNNLVSQERESDGGGGGKPLFGL